MNKEIFEVSCKNYGAACQLSQERFAIWGKENYPEHFQQYKQATALSEQHLEEAVAAAFQYLKTSDDSFETLVERVILQTREGLFPVCYFYIAISLMWKQPSSRMEQAVQQALEFLLGLNEYREREDYYVESFLDIWEGDFDSNIPISLLEAVCLKEQQTDSYSYGAFIKAASYLKSHPQTDQKQVLKKLKPTHRYQTDAYFRMWLVEE